MFCTKCGASLAGRRKFCGQCGAPVGASSTQISTASIRPASAPRGLKTCRDCGHMVSPGAKACPNCGARRPGVGRIVYGIGGALGIIVGVFILIGIESSGDKSTGTSKSSSLASQPPDITTTAPQLFADYQATKWLLTRSIRTRSFKFLERSTTSERILPTPSM